MRGKMEERTERESESKRSGRLVGAAETSKEHAEWRRLQRKNLSAVDKIPGDAFAKKKRAVCPEYQIMRGERVKVGDSRTLAIERRIRARAWRGKSGLHSEGKQIPRRKGRAS